MKCQAIFAIVALIFLSCVPGDTPVPVPKELFRSRPTILSQEEAQSMLRQKDLFCKRLNPIGKGFKNDFEEQVIEGDRVVIDYAADLVWETYDHWLIWKAMALKDVRPYIKDRLNKERYAGFDDWRLPTLEEALSLMEPRNNRHIDRLFGNLSHIWTSDTVKVVIDEEKQIWAVNFMTGQCSPSYINLYSAHYVRAVRSRK